MSEVLRSIRLVGIAVGGTFLPWRADSLALFGLNGAGKTRFLKAIEALCSGGSVLRSSASLIIQMNEEGPVSNEALVGGTWHLATDDLLCEYLTQVDGILGLAGALEVDAEMVEEAYSRTLTRSLLTVPSAHAAEFAPDWCSIDEARMDLALTEEGRGLLNDLLRQRMFEVRSGSAGLEVRPYVLVEPHFRHLRMHVARTAQAIAASVAEHGEDSSDLFREFSPFDVQDLETLEGVRVQGGALQPGNWSTISGTPRGRLGISCIDVDAIGREQLTVLTQGVLRAEAVDHEAMVKLATLFSKEATASFQRSIATPAELVLDVPPALQLMTGAVVEWRASPVTGRALGSGKRVALNKHALDELSFAEKRWAVVAILGALGELARASLVLMDEPEHGLPRNAEAAVVANLLDLTVRKGGWLCLASHSPAFLSAPDLTAVKVSRPRQGIRHLAKLSDRGHSTLLDMGLTPLDVLATRKGFLLVEGAHDELVLQELIGTELSQLGVEILPLRGGSKLPGSIESQVLFDFTEAMVFAMLDATAMTSFTVAWECARDTLKSDGVEAAKAVLLTQIPDAASCAEELWLRTWLIRAMERDLASRVVPLGVGRADIIEYLPVNALVEGASSWDALREQHAAALKNGRANTPKDFKKWLERGKRSNFSPENLREACRSMDEIPTDVTDVLTRIGEKTQSPNS